MVARFKRLLLLSSLTRVSQFCAIVFGIKIRFAHHSQDTSGGWFQYNYRSSAVSQRIVCRCLKICIQTGDHGITLILFPRNSFFICSRKNEWEVRSWKFASDSKPLLPLVSYPTACAKILENGYVLSSVPSSYTLVCARTSPSEDWILPRTTRSENVS